VKLWILDDYAAASAFASVVVAATASAASAAAAYDDKNKIHVVSKWGHTSSLIARVCKQLTSCTIANHNYSFSNYWTIVIQ